VVTHEEDSGAWLSKGKFTEAKRMTVEPSWARLLIVPKGQPHSLKLPDFLAVLAMSQIDHVSDALCL
jgi:hypothetical protein